MRRWGKPAGPCKGSSAPQKRHRIVPTDSLVLTPSKLVLGEAEAKQLFHGQNWRGVYAIGVTQGHSNAFSEAVLVSWRFNDSVQTLPKTMMRPKVLAAVVAVTGDRILDCEVFWCTKKGRVVWPSEVEPALGVWGDEAMGTSYTPEELEQTRHWFLGNLGFESTFTLYV